ncbi:hypothetical protein [Geodermatophilus sp. SYSU D01105]
MAAAVLVSVAPGVASAAPTYRVTPLLSCYSQNSDGSWTLVLGYRNSASTQLSIPHGPDNHATTNGSTKSTAYTNLLPGAFNSGTQQAVLWLTVSNTDFMSGADWYLDGTHLVFLTAAKAGSACPGSTPLPADGNETGAVTALVVAGAVGAVLLRRSYRRTSGASGADGTAT